jgi:hypothetical protein
VSARTTHGVKLVYLQAALALIANCGRHSDVCDHLDKAGLPNAHTWIYEGQYVWEVVRIVLAAAKKAGLLP